MAYEKSCGALVFKQVSGKIYSLIIRQNQGHWCFPKGHVKTGETEEETAFREVLEETGLEVKFVDGFKAQTHYKPRVDVDKDVIYFIGQPVGGVEKVQEDELSEMRWVKNVEAMSLLTYDNDIELFKKAMRFIRSSVPEYGDVDL